MELTDDGKIASAETDTPERLRSRIKLAIENVPPFNHLFKAYAGKKLPTHDVIKDKLAEGEFAVEEMNECIDTFIVNAKDLGLLKVIGGAETLLSADHVVEEKAKSGGSPPLASSSTNLSKAPLAHSGKVEWSKTCFFITPIGDDGSDIRKHADLFLSSLVEPALAESGLQLVRADRIGDPGMITSQILEYIMRARLAIVDMSHHNPNVFTIPKET